MRSILGLTFGIILIQSVLCIKPSFLWGTLNATLLERKVPKYCTKLIFHNNVTLADAVVGGNYSGIVGNSFLDIHQTFSSGEFHGDWDAAERTLQEGQKLLIEEKVDPCLVVASFVFDSVQYDQHLENSTFKRNFRHRLSDLLQFSTPIRSRHLILFRIAEEFINCPGGPKYPTRLVPQWEMVLFDFFHEARAIQGPFHEADEPYLKVTRETGKWRWLCDDILEKLRLERSCKLNATCLLENELIGQWDPRVLPSIQPCKLGFRPRQ